MKQLFTLATIVFALTSCSKNDKPVHMAPPMQYIDLKESTIEINTYKQIDVDGDDKTDFTFSTLLVGDPVLKRDELHFYAYSHTHSLLLNNEHDESPVLKKDELIPVIQNDFTWYELSAILLVEKLMYPDESVFWDGLWKNANHRFLPIQVRKDGKSYFGWIEMSFDKEAEKLILHKAAICKEPNRAVKAGS